MGWFQEENIEEISWALSFYDYFVITFWDLKFVKVDTKMIETSFFFYNNPNNREEQSCTVYNYTEHFNVLPLLQYIIYSSQ